MSKLDEFFAARRWRVKTEADGTGHAFDSSGANHTLVHFRQGHFEVDPPGAFTSPLGSRGRKGVLLQEVDENGQDIEGSVTLWGESTVQTARESYHAIV